jgi:hypothetical protein
MKNKFDVHQAKDGRWHCQHMTFKSEKLARLYADIKTRDAYRKSQGMQEEPAPVNTKKLNYQGILAGAVCLSVAVFIAVLIYKSRDPEGTPEFEAYVACREAFKLFSKDLENVKIPYVPSYDNKMENKEYYFVWNGGTKRINLEGQQGSATAACMVEKKQSKFFT